MLDFAEFSWMASTWHAIDQLCEADPKPGDRVSVARLPNKGRSHQYRIKVVGTEGGEGDDEPIPY